MSPGTRRVSVELVRAYAVSEQQAATEWIAEDRTSRTLVTELQLLAQSPRSVLIYGETGTGKTQLARLLHAQSDAAAQPLHVINCAALADSRLAELLLALDHEGAQTHPGTRPIVLLDEVGELSPWSQAVLLHKLQDGRRVPGRGSRFVAATHRELGAMAACGTFSRELLALLSSARIALAPLRDRRDDIVPLALHFLRCALSAHGRAFVTVDPDMLQCLEHHDWPGNARELRNAMLRMLAVNDGDTLQTTDLPDAVRHGGLTNARLRRPGSASG